MKKLLILAALLSACDAKAPEADSSSTRQHSVTIMTFNVENLFDNLDDAGKDDKTFLALRDKQSDEHKRSCAEIEVEHWRDQCFNWDWSDQVIAHKLDVVADSILQVGGGRGPDIVALQEVENLSILERLRTEYLGAADYRPAILIEGDDLRGIDVAFLSRLELAGEPTLHRIPFADFEDKRVVDTRGILQADFVLADASVLTGFAVHFPAPFHPTGMREAAYEHLNRLKSSLPPGRAAFAAGDFNTTASEDREKRMLERYVRPHWIIAHELGCGGCRGTHYYEPRDDWSFLDMILWAPGEDRGAQATWEIRADSVQIANAVPDQRQKDGTPARFELPDGRGVSDHWPLVVMLQSK